MNIFYDALTYPVRKHGWQILLASTVVWALVLFTLAIPLVNLGLLVAYWGYFGSYYLAIISDTASGNDTMPNWPDLTNVIDSVIKPLARLAAILVNAWLPLMIVLALQKYGVPVPRVLGIAAWAYGVLSWPMTALLVQLSGRWRAGLPHIVFPAMVEMGWTYVLASLVCVAALLAYVYVLPLVFGRTVAGGLARMAGLIYLLAFQGRLTGLLYRVAKAREKRSSDNEQAEI